MIDISDRIRNKAYISRVTTAEEAAKLIHPDDIVAVSGFTPAGYPKAVPLALAKRIGREHFQITLYAGASIGDEIDGALARVHGISHRFSYHTNKDLRREINDGSVAYADYHVSVFAQMLKEGFMKHPDIVMVEAAAITEEGNLIPTTSVGTTPAMIDVCQKVVVEINVTQPLSLEGMHDVYDVPNPPFREPIPIVHTGDRIGKPYITCGWDKIVAIVPCDIPDAPRSFKPVDENGRKMGNLIVQFFKDEVAKGRLPEHLLPLQSGVGSVANAVIQGLAKSDFEHLSIFTEVLQDGMFTLIDAGKVDAVSTASLSASPEGLNTAIEFDIYGQVNSTHICGSRLMNGIGGSGDFARAGYLTIFFTSSTAKNGAISSVVPMCSHVDHTEHDVDILCTEQGIADLRGLSPVERARTIIANCAYPDYRDRLTEYLDRAIAATGSQHEPQRLKEALSWQQRYLETGTME